MKIRSIIAITAALLGAAGASATPLTFEFSPGPGEANLGNSHVFTSGIYSITAYGYTRPANSPTALYQKFDGVGETGLGLASDGDTEIPPGFYIQLDVSNLIAQGITDITLKLGSLQTGEQANIYKDTTAGSFADGVSAASLVGGATIQWTDVSLTSQFLNITGGGSDGADPVLESATINTPNVPDSGSTVMMLGAGLLGLAGMVRVRSSRK